MIWAASGSFHVSPSIGVIGWTVLFGLLLVGGVITAMKGRWPWLLAGLFIPLLWLVGAFRAATADSLWARLFFAEDRRRSLRALPHHR